MKYYVIAGEKSGDLHAANLVKALKAEDLNARFRGFGGDDMQSQGVEIVKHYKDLAFMGFIEVVKNIRTISKNLAFCQKDILEFQPDVVILVDYPGFNLRIARFAKQKGLKVFYYISPKIWAWNTKRAWKIKANVDKMFVIFPFEEKFYQQFDYQVDYVGNPLLDAISAYQPNLGFLQKNRIISEKPIIALLPGSRKQELENILSRMLSIIRHFPDYQLVVSGVSNLPADIYEKIIGKNEVKVVFDQTYDLLTHATAALVTSGTATLETALFEVPQVVCYKTSGFSYQIAKAVIKIPFISLVNLVAEKEVVKELIQEDLNEIRIADELKKILPAGEKRTWQIDEYQLLKNRLGTAGASETTAKLMVKYLKDE